MFVIPAHAGGNREVDHVFCLCFLFSDWIPAKDGEIEKPEYCHSAWEWIPAFAGMTAVVSSDLRSRKELSLPTDKGGR